MAELTLVKTTDDGVAIYLDPSDGRFEAVPGCTCRGGKGHIEYGWRSCKAKRITRKSMKDLETEIHKVLSNQAPFSIQAIDVGNTYTEPRVITIINVEPGGKYENDRYRSAGGDLVRSGTDIRQHDPLWFAALQERYQAVQEARARYDNFVKGLPRLDRATFRRLRAEARSTGQPAPPEQEAVLREQARTEVGQDAG